MLADEPNKWHMLTVPLVGFNPCGIPVHSLENRADADLNTARLG